MKYAVRYLPVGRRKVRTGDALVISGGRAVPVPEPGPFTVVYVPIGVALNDARQWGRVKIYSHPVYSKDDWVRA